ncbi:MULTISPECIES: hypothetical protein [Trichocoleus]|uniref:CD-NTase-associated protein 12/Pycsar effector protein TIR domain-containing protein n=1 Tax=Trichocoleus desertorum GB2-A4 TaxID=2933944 RepID=A0ABV0JD77_9CYAN|nr:hypothetical protein [Trichocoleus sp. FACHB-46]MBD1864382.1 hypothetical protein [Trichocoleus sp. FACHB-46]
MINIFYSWQSDLPNSTNRGFIESALMKSVKSINQEELSIVRVDRDTKDLSGTPDIASSIFQKISNSNVFVCDITPINTSFLTGDHNDLRAIPNPNVLVELGYAASCLGWDRVICILNLAHCSIEKLPFDLRSRRIYTYYLKVESENKADTRNRLVADIKNALNLMIPHITNKSHKEIAFYSLRSEILNHLKLLVDMLKGSVQAKPHDEYENVKSFFNESFYSEIKFLDISKIAIDGGSSYRQDWESYICSGCLGLKTALGQMSDRYSSHLEPLIVQLIEEIINSEFIQLMINIQASTKQVINAPRFSNLFSFSEINKTVKEHVELFLELIDVYNQLVPLTKTIRVPHQDWDYWWDDHVQPFIGSARINI